MSACDKVCRFLRICDNTCQCQTGLRQFRALRGKRTQYPRRSFSFLGHKHSFLWGPFVCKPRSKVKQWPLGFISSESNPGRRTLSGLSFLERVGGAFESEVLLDRQRNTSLRLHLLTKEGKTLPPAPQQSGGSWCEQQPKARTK